VSNIFIGLNKTCLGVLERGDRDKYNETVSRGERDKYNETGMKEGEGIEMSTTVLPLRDARSLRLNTHLDFSMTRIVHST